MPRGDKSKYTDKQERKADHIAEGYEKRGVSDKEAERRAWATVNKDDGGGKKEGGSGRGKHTGHPSSHKGGEAGGSASAKRSSAEKEGGSGRGEHTGHPAAHKGGKIGGKASASRSASSRSESAKKAAATRKRNAEHRAH